MEVRQLQYFVAVAEERHFSRASERLLIAQPALSQQIRKLEKQLGTPLFTRTTRRVELTDSGVVLLGHARRVLADVERAQLAVQRSLLGEAGEVKLAFVSSVALDILPRLTRAIRADAPGLSLVLLERTTSVQLDALRQGDIDLGIVREVYSAPELALEVLASERLYLAVHHSHRLASRRTVSLTELAEEQFVFFPRQAVSRLYDHIVGLCDASGFELRITQEAGQFATILGVVAGNGGTAIVPSPYRSVQLPGLRYLGIEEEAAVSTVSLAYSPERLSRATVRRVYGTAMGVFDLASIPFS